ncbi:MAG: hypothetical protein WCS87_01690 [Methylococcaceae bacterium]
MSVILKINQLETIFNHEITAAELLALANGYEETQKEYFYGLDQDSAYADLYRLYILRGDTDKAAFFIEKIKDNQFKIQFKTRPCCSVNS